MEDLIAIGVAVAVALVLFAFIAGWAWVKDKFAEIRWVMRSGQ